MNKTELIERPQHLTEDELSEVLAFVNLLREPPEELTEVEVLEVQEGQNDFTRGDWMRFEDVRRTDV